MLVLPKGNGTLGKKKKKKNGAKGPSSQIPFSVFPFTQCTQPLCMFCSITLAM